MINNIFKRTTDLTIAVVEAFYSEEVIKFTEDEYKAMHNAIQKRMLGKTKKVELEGIESLSEEMLASLIDIAEVIAPRMGELV